MSEKNNKIIVKDGIGHIDTLITKFCLNTLDFWNRIGATPNVLTTLGLVASILSLYFFYHTNSEYAILFLIVRCYFDYADGLLARKFEQISEIGDWYDHVTDWLYGFGIFAVVYKISDNALFHLSLIGLFTCLYLIHMGCIEKEYIKHSQKETSISRLRHYSVKPELMKYFDNGTLYLVVIVVMLSVSKQN